MGFLPYGSVGWLLESFIEGGAVWFLLLLRGGENGKGVERGGWKDKIMGLEAAKGINGMYSNNEFIIIHY